MQAERVSDWAAEARETAAADLEATEAERDQLQAQLEEVSAPLLDTW